MVPAISSPSTFQGIDLSDILVRFEKREQESAELSQICDIWYLKVDVVCTVTSSIKTTSYYLVTEDLTKRLCLAFQMLYSP